MKIYRKLIIDIATDRIVEADAIDYNGSIARTKGESRTTTSVKVAAPTAEEKRRQAIADFEQTQSVYSQGYDITDNGQGGYSFTKRALNPQEQADQDFQDKLKAKIQQQLLGGPVDPETEKLVNDVYASAETKGNASIDQYARELAGARGLDLNTDSPIQREALKARGEFQTSLGGARSAALLNSGQAAQIFAQNQNEFIQSLQQQAFQNRQAIMGGAYQGADSLANQRFAAATRTTKGMAGGGGFSGSGALSGAASGASAGSAFGPWGAAIGGVGGGIAGGFFGKT